MCQVPLLVEAEAATPCALLQAPLGGQAVGRLFRDASQDLTWDVSWSSLLVYLSRVSSSLVFSWVTLPVSGTRLCAFCVQVLHMRASPRVNPMASSTA
jgi:hypothetical protein